MLFRSSQTRAARAGRCAVSSRCENRHLPNVSYHDTLLGVIRSFNGKFAEAILAERQIPKGFPQGLARVARRKLVQLNNAVVLADLAVPPGNQLEALKGGLAGKHSIRINDQWRIVFRWTQAGPEEVEIVDYH